MIRGSLALPFSYLKWHYTKAYIDIYRVIRNIMWFLWHFFAIPLHLKTLFVPWRRLSEETKRRFDIGERVGNFIVNTLMRIVGAIVRIIFIVMGLCILFSTLFVSVLVALVWAFIPIVLVYLVINGVALLFP